MLKHAQYINPLKRNVSGATSAISNLALKFATVLENMLGEVFGMTGKEAVVDKVRSQWILFQKELKEEWFQKTTEDDNQPSSSRKQDSYWARAFDECGLDSPASST